jgi:hypothetical protein
VEEDGTGWFARLLGLGLRRDLHKTAPVSTSKVNSVHFYLKV